MAKTDEKVMALVEEELAKKPDATVDELYDKAKSASSAVGKLTKRQFNARYPLQVKRRSKAKGGKRGGAPKKPARKRGGRKKARASRKAAAQAPPAAPAAPAANREKVRQVFLRFASDLAAAEARKDLVKVLSLVDKYVDQAVKAAGR